MINPPLKRHPGLLPLSHDHHFALVAARHLLRGADGDDEQRRAAVAEFAKAWREQIERHFADEERVLVPFMNPQDTARLTKEHELLRGLAAEAVADPMKRGDWMRHTAHFLEEHIRWEERQLFPELERSLGEQRLRELEQRLQGR